MWPYGSHSQFTLLSAKSHELLPIAHVCKTAFTVGTGDAGCSPCSSALLSQPETRAWDLLQWDRSHFPTRRQGGQLGPQPARKQQSSPSIRSWNGANTRQTGWGAPPPPPRARVRWHSAEAGSPGTRGDRCFRVMHIYAKSSEWLADRRDGQALT